MTNSKSSKGTLYLVPNTLGKTPENNTIPEYVLRIIRRLDVWIVENIQSAVRYLQWVGDTVPDYEIDFLLLNKKTPDHEAASFIRPLLEGRDAGLLSEAGCPAIADPGSKLIHTAHTRNIPVVPLVGPSSILLALIASGFNGQSFTFHGYLPIDSGKRKEVIQKLEGESAKTGYTQIFMETPHRNHALIKDILKTCRPGTQLSVACNLTLPSEKIITQSVGEWKKSGGGFIDKDPAIFLINAGR